MGDFAAVAEEEMADVPEGERTGWALLQLADAIDAEVDRLRAHRETLDLDAITENRADSIAAAARFDPSPEAARAHRYEQAAARELSRTLVDLHRAEALAAPEPEPEPEPAGPTPEPEPPIVATLDGANSGRKSIASKEIGSGLASFGASGDAAAAAGGSVPGAGPTAVGGPDGTATPPSPCD